MTTERVLVYSEGILRCSVCVADDATSQEIELAVSDLNPTGLAHGWQISKEAVFATGESNPHPCEKEPGRTHWLMEC